MSIKKVLALPYLRTSLSLPGLALVSLAISPTSGSVSMLASGPVLPVRNQNHCWLSWVVPLTVQLNIPLCERSLIVAELFRSVSVKIVACAGVRTYTAKNNIAAFRRTRKFMLQSYNQPAFVVIGIGSQANSGCALAAFF